MNKIKNFISNAKSAVSAKSTELFCKAKSALTNLIEKEEYRKVVAQTLRSIEPYIDSIERNDFNFGKQNEE